MRTLRKILIWSGFALAAGSAAIGVWFAADKLYLSASIMGLLVFCILVNIYALIISRP
jgi:hypothetical protein